MNKQRQALVNDIERMRGAIRKTSSPHLVRDYSKAIKRKRKELAIYDRYMKQNDKSRMEKQNYKLV